MNATENVIPWALGGDSSGNFQAVIFNVGSHTLNVTAHTGNGAGGTQTDSFSISFKDILVDYSKNRITGETMNLLFSLARECKLEESISPFSIELV